MAVSTRWLGEQLSNLVGTGVCQPFPGVVIAAGGSGIGMTQRILQVVQRHTEFQSQGGVGVTQDVGADRLGDPCSPS